MESNEKDLKIKELTDKVEFLSSIIIKAHKYAKNDPEVALTQARKSAEAICRNIFSAEIGEPGKIMLDELIKKLAERKILPTKILIPLGTIQAYGNYGTHAQSSQESIDFNYITPCLSALAQVSSWYFIEYLKTNIPADLAAEEVKDSHGNSPGTDSQGPSGPVIPPLHRVPAAKQSPPKKSSALWISLGAAIVVIIAAVVIFTRQQKTESSTGGAKPDTSISLTAAPPLQTVKDSSTLSTQKQAEPGVAKNEPAKGLESSSKNPVQGSHPTRTSTENPTNPSGEKAAAQVPPTQAPPATADVDPSILKDVPPVYPPSMKGSNINGEVRLNVHVDANGNPTEARVLSYDDERFQQAAIDAVMHYKFNPGLAAGKPVPAWANIHVKFTSK